MPPATSVRSLDLRSPAAVPPDEHAPLATGSDVCLVSFVCCVRVCVCVCVCKGGRCECACGKKGCGKFELSICVHLSMLFRKVCTNFVNAHLSVH